MEPKISPMAADKLLETPTPHTIRLTNLPKKKLGGSRGKSRDANRRRSSIQHAVIDNKYIREGGERVVFGNMSNKMMKELLKVKTHSLAVDTLTLLEYSIMTCLISTVLIIIIYLPTWGHPYNGIEDNSTFVYISLPVGGKSIRSQSFNLIR